MMIEELQTQIDFLTLERDELQTRNSELLEIAVQQQEEIERLKRTIKRLVKELSEDAK